MGDKWLAKYVESAATSKELRERHELLDRMRLLRAEKPLKPGPFPSTEEMLKKDRER